MFQDLDVVIVVYADAVTDLVPTPEGRPMSFIGVEISAGELAA